ncbi:cobalt ECF transporter T component CbiQ [Stackebrandtia nassauensis]|uniref:Cobalt ABC transporter, inner membrane subunit CbiQ n=1 Tax=Stackebrandtia nassauensis (strain DSM 44728 / CIP 108903 / NRRL B-16338 / NBRC 102104 / LLR-40K-21) TaxID=446470 RepID=D3PWB7_STANL|nr:cobalt ECF transporter T component CbiQ [Stackebrandtia nassauensis]ADD41274.1 cobalt ABC transporter, inner membrane subunit CbiQ [Stackebrandtia nassauensis DSM 44728]
MGAGHALYRPGTTPVHRLPGEVKIAASVTFTIAVVATPRQAVWAFGCYALLLLAVMAVARITPLWLAKRSLIEVPFVALAVLLPFMEGGPYTTWLGLEVSVPGSWGAWNILAKATLGVWASLTLAATTDVTALLAGLNRLRCPAVITQLATFMVRYTHVLASEARRMRVARISRGDNPRFLWQLKGFATGVGVLFLRSFERGERVYVAMLSRGYNGQMPLGSELRAAAVTDWARAALLPVAAGAIAATAIML